MKIERREFGTRDAQIQHSKADGEMPTIRGRVTPFNSVTPKPIHGVFFERVAPGAFKRALKDDDTDCSAVINHADEGLPLARFAAGEGSLSLRESEDGLYFEFVPPDTEAGRAAVKAIERKDIRGMSFAFRARKESWNDKGHNGMPLRTLEDVDIFDISLLTKTPAYGGTSIKMRSDEMGEQEYRALAAQAQGTTQQQRARKLRLLELTKTE